MMESITKLNNFFGHLAGLQCRVKLNGIGNMKLCMYVAITLNMQKKFLYSNKNINKNFWLKHFCSLANLTMPCRPAKGPTVPDKMLFVLNYF